ncbi:reverse transcriptase domain-containing protein [Tanacetum coccineum]
MMSSFFQMQSPSGSGSLPSNTIANLRGELKAITTRSGVSYDGPMILPTSSPLPKEVEREPEVTKDKPDVAPKPNPKPSIPYPSRLNDQKLREKANNQILLSNKEKLFELANNPLNENCSTVLLKKLPKKLGHPGKFLIPCDFLELVKCLALVDLGASLNLMPLSVRKKLSLPELTPTLMTLELANQSVAYPVGVSEDVFVKVGKFHFPADFIVVDYDVDPRVPLILRRPFLRTARALIDVHGKELTLRVNDEAITFNDISKSGNPTPSLDHIITTSFPFITPFEGDILLLKKLLNNDPSSPLPSKELHFEELKTIKSFIDDPPELELKDLPSHLKYAFSEGTNKLPVIIAKNLKDDEKARLLKKLNDATRKDYFTLPFMDIMLERLAGKEYYCFLDGFSVDFQIPIDPQDQEKTTFTCPYGTCTMAIFHDMIKETIEDFMDDFSVFGDSLSSCLSHLYMMLKQCEDINLVLNWEKCHFMVKEGIVLGHKISKSSIEVDRAKVDVIAKLPHPTSIKGAVLGQRKTKHFQPTHHASKTMTDAQAHYTTTEKEILAVVYAFEKFRSYLVLSKTIVYTDHLALKYLLAKQDAKPRLLRWILLLREFDVIIRDKKGAENLVDPNLRSIP